MKLSTSLLALSYIVGHFNAAGPALYSVTPTPDGTLLIESLRGGARIVH